MAKKFAALLFSFTVLILGFFYFLNNLSLSYDAVIGGAKLILPASIIIGGFGYLIGKVLETSTNGEFLGFGGSSTQFNIDDLLTPVSEMNDNSYDEDIDSFSFDIDNNEPELIGDLDDNSSDLEGLET